MRAAGPPDIELLQEDVDDVSEGGGHAGFFIQQAQQSLERGKGLEGMPGVFGPLKVLVACQQQSGYGISCQHLHNPHSNFLNTICCYSACCLTACNVSKFATCIGVYQNNAEQISTSTVRRCYSGAEKQGREYSSCETQNVTGLCKHINRPIMKAQPVSGVTSCNSLTSLLQAMLSAQERDLPG